MKNKKLLIALCLFSLCGCILSLYTGLTVEGSGFFDVSNLVQIACFTAATLFGFSTIASFLFMTKK